MRSLLLAMIVISTACSKHVTTAEDCRTVLDRVTAKEFEHLKIADTKLLEEKSAQFRMAFQADLKQCEGLRVSQRVFRCTADRSNAGPLDDCFVGK